MPTKQTQRAKVHEEKHTKHVVYEAIRYAIRYKKVSDISPDRPIAVVLNALSNRQLFEITPALSVGCGWTRDGRLLCGFLERVRSDDTSDWSEAKRLLIEREGITASDGQTKRVARNEPAWMNFYLALSSKMSHRFISKSTKYDYCAEFAAFRIELSQEIETEILRTRP